MNLEKNYTNKIFIDAGNSYLKIGYIVDEQLIIEKIANSELNDKSINKLLSKYQNIEIYWISVCLSSTELLLKLFKKHQYTNTQITNKDFIGKLVVNDKADFNEIGIDILCFAYYIKNSQNALGINFGTATVAMNYNLGLEGVVIGPSFSHAYSDLIKLLKLNKSDLSMVYDDFGTNTIDAINGSQYFLLNGFVNQLLHQYNNINTIYISGGDMDIFYQYKNIYAKNIEICEEICLKGLISLILGIKTPF